jgi:hypothetical protein
MQSVFTDASSRQDSTAQQSFCLIDLQRIQFLYPGTILVNQTVHSCDIQFEQTASSEFGYYHENHYKTAKPDSETREQSKRLE